MKYWLKKLQNNFNDTLMLKYCVSLIFLLSLSSFASDIKKKQEPKDVITINSNIDSLEEKLGDWYVSVSSENTDGDDEYIRKVYITSFPVEQIGTQKTRKKPSIQISCKQREVEVSVASGFEISKNTILTVNDEDFELKKNKDTAYSDHNQVDKIISKMKKSFKLSSLSQSSSYTYMVDKYSMAGFIKAYEKMISMCQRN